MYPVRLDSGLPWSVVYDLLSWYCVEVLCGYHEVTGSFDEVADFNPDVPEESIYGPSPNGNDCF